MLKGDKNMDTTEVASYVQELSSQKAQEFMAEKSGAVRAELVTDDKGKDITTIVKDGFVEVKEHADKGQYILTAVDTDTKSPIKILRLCPYLISHNVTYVKLEQLRICNFKRRHNKTAHEISPLRYSQRTFVTPKSVFKQ